MNTITVSWTNSNSDPNNVCGPVMYKVTISGPGVNNTDITNTKMNTFTGLTPNTEYTITITPFNDAGDGLSDVVVVMTMPTVPLPPTDIQLSLEFNNGTPSINASWRAPELDPTMTKVEEYNLRLYINGSLQATTNVPANTTMVDIFTAFGPNITRERCTNYSLSVAAINSAGIGEFSKSDVVTRYIQEAGPTQGVGWITLSCTTASSDPAVKCDAIITCNNETAVNVELNTSLVHTTTQPCNITIKVTFRNNTTIILDQIMFTNVTPLIQHTATTTTGSGPTPRMPSTGESKPNDDDNTGRTVSITIAVFCMVLLIVIFVVVVCCWRYSRKRELALIHRAMTCTCCTCLMCAYCAKKRSNTMKQTVSSSKNKTNTGSSSSSEESPHFPNSADTFVEGNTTKDTTPQGVPLYSEINPAPQKRGSNSFPSVPLYSEVQSPRKAEEGDKSSTAQRLPMCSSTVQEMPMYSQVDDSKKTIRVQQLPEYSTVHDPPKSSL
ncbi:uncharacterized protein [Dysidea avara]|uniref:uncharacterized protein isoform X2 n=1 Tax=Dysidea avara TaxID=196820 RepID=UPI0033218453